VIVPVPLIDGERIFLTPQITATTSSGYIVTTHMIQTKDGKHIVFTDAESASSETEWSSEIAPEEQNRQT